MYNPRYDVAQCGEIEIKAYPKRHTAPQSAGLINEGQSTMGGIGKKDEHTRPADADDDGKRKKSPPRVSEDDDIEDGDIATPKRDRDDE